MQLFGIAVLVIATLLVIAALFGSVGTFPVALIALVAAAALVFLWRGTDVRRPPDTRA